jgi:hypothetical protein
MLRINTAISYRLKDPGFDSKHGQDILFLKKNTHTHKDQLGGQPSLLKTVAWSLSPQVKRPGREATTPLNQYSSPPTRLCGLDRDDIRPTCTVKAHTNVTYQQSRIHRGMTLFGFRFVYA